MTELSLFYYYAFHESFTVGENLAIASEIDRLCDEVKKSPFAREFHADIILLRKITDAVREQNKGQSATLPATNKSIGALQILGHFFLGAFLATTPINKKYKEGDLSFEERCRMNEAYKPIVMVCAFRVFEKQGFDNSVRKACDEIRLIASGFKRKKYYLTNYDNVDNLDSLVTSISKDIERSDKSNESRLGGIYSVIKLAKELGGVQCSDKAFVPNQAKKKTLLTKQRQQSERNTITHMRGIEATVRQKPQPQGENNLDEDASSIANYDDYQQVSFNNKRPRPTAVSQAQANAISKRIASSKRRLSTDMNQASERDIKRLLTELFASIQSNNEDANVCKLILLSLLIGTNLDKLKYCHFEVTEHHCKLIHELKLQNYHSLKKHRESYAVYLPDCLASVLEDIHFSLMAWQDSAKQFIRQFDQAHQAKLSINKISGFIDTHLLSRGVDRTVMSLLTNPNPRHQMALNYVTTDEATINQQFSLYVDYLQTLAENPNFLIISPFTHKHNIVGSKATVTDTEIVQIFQRLLAEINQNNSKQTRYTDDFHNLYALYTYLLLTLASGYRPVDETLGYLHSYQRSLGIVHIIDKEKGQHNEGRQIYLCDVAKQQLRHYLDYCEYRYYHFKVTLPRLAKRYQKVTQSKAPLLFFIGNNGEYWSANQAYLKPLFEQFNIAVNRYNADAKADIVVRLPLNWHRHYVRSLLLRESLLPDSLITEEKANAWMGHDSKENDIPLAKFSHLSVLDLKSVANLLTTQFQSLGITPIEAR